MLGMIVEQMVTVFGFPIFLNCGRNLELYLLRHNTNNRGGLAVTLLAVGTAGCIYLHIGVQCAAAAAGKQDIVKDDGFPVCSVQCDGNIPCFGSALSVLPGTEQLCLIGTIAGRILFQRQRDRITAAQLGS